jgi:outer membrane protein assembly factor BamB
MVPPRHRVAALGVAVIVVSVAACGSASKPASTPTPTAETRPATVTTIPPHPPTGQTPTAAAGTAAATAWPEALHDSRHSSSALAVGPDAGKILWTRKLGAALTAGAVVAADGTIYDSGGNGILHALNPSTGTDIWTYNGGGSTDNNEDLSVSPAILADGTIAWPGPNGTLDGISPAGKLLWQEKLAGTVLSPAVGSSGTLYVADSKGDVEAFRASAAGATRSWKINVGASSFAFGSPAIGPNGAIYVTSGRDLIALADHGSRASVTWRYQAGAQIEVSASVAPDGTIVLGTNDPYEYGIAPAGKVAWRYPRKIFSFSTPAVSADGIAYFGDNDGYVDAVRAATGQVLGRYGVHTRALSSMGAGVWTAPLVDSRHDVYFGTASGHVIGLNYDGGLLFDLPTGSVVASYPALTANGTLLIGSENGTLYAIHT